jgi:hypothetical protein
MMQLTSPAPNRLSCGCGHTFAAVQWAQDIATAFVRPPRARPASLDATAAAAAHAATRAGAAPAVPRQSTISPWIAIDLDVSAVIGDRGTAAVLRQALATARRTHGWLPAPSDECGFGACLACLGDALDHRCNGEAEAAGLAVQAAFRELLVALLGGPLTAQLLGARASDPRTQGEPMP